MKVKLGATRIVFVFKKVVIKIPNFHEYRLFLHGILANLQEKVWSRLGGRDDLAKVKFCGPLGIILVMEKAEVYTEELDRIGWTEEDFEANLQELYKNDDLKEFMLSDPKSSNWGTINDRLVKIDYGD